MKKAASDSLPPELRMIVKESVKLLGQVLEEELGATAYRRIESVRLRMAGLRKASAVRVSRELERTYRELEKLKRPERLAFARAYTLMLELMNGCENAYRTYRLSGRNSPSLKGGPDAIYYVLTAHPTEARSPGNIEIFHLIQEELVQILKRGFTGRSDRLKSLLCIAWRIPIVRTKKPRVQDEAEHVYSILLKPKNLSTLLDLGESGTPIFIRSWVGGDKDGHPGVDEKVLEESLQISRNFLLRYAKTELRDFRAMLALFQSHDLHKKIRPISDFLSSMAQVRAEDGKRASGLGKALIELQNAYEDHYGPAPTPLKRLIRLFRVFPGFVVPLELREDSGVLMSDPTGDRIAIGRMLKKIGQISRGADPCWYARGLIISMAESLEHIRTAYRIAKRQVGNDRIPIVPLFEKKSALDQGAEIISAVLSDPILKKAIRERWNNKMEIMLGYSDSAKESGVIASRLAVSLAMQAIDRSCARKNVIPVFFHGSGGSVDRGGGSIQDQMAAWPKSALKIYKATLQGEMIERSFASSEILESQIQKIVQTASPERQKKSIRLRTPAFTRFSELASEEYKRMIVAPKFLQVVEKATPYPYLSALKMGSRPTKRSGSLSVSALRAIPWVLCWTQTRVLFPTWWGVGTAWTRLKASERKSLRRDYAHHPLFRAYIHALGFTLAKIELPVWEFYLAQSDLSEKDIAEFKNKFRTELGKVNEFIRAVTGHVDPLWYRPWLAKSIGLRSSMIHPLNLLGIQAQKQKDLPLLRVSVTGIASGMLTTG